METSADIIDNYIKNYHVNIVHDNGFNWLITNRFEFLQETIPNDKDLQPREDEKNKYFWDFYEIAKELTFTLMIIYLKTISEDYDNYCDMLKKYTRKAITESIQLNKKYNENYFFHMLINVPMLSKRRKKILSYIKEMEENIDILAFKCIKKMEVCLSDRMRNCIEKSINGTCAVSKENKEYFNNVYRVAKRHGYKQGDEYKSIKSNKYFNPFRRDYDVEKEYGNETSV